MIIAIDGPSGAGKSTVSKEVAKRLGFSCLDTGAMYRSVTWMALANHVDLDDADALSALARDNAITFGRIPGDPMPHTVYIHGADVTKAIRSREVDHAVSRVSAVSGVRDAMLIQQRRMGMQGNYVIEGRDIGTVVFPDADLKIFLTASDDERARRRVVQNRARGVGSTDFASIRADLCKRDQDDSSRAIAALKPADDACRLDSTDMSMQQVIDTICQRAQCVDRKGVVQYDVS